MSGKIKCRMWKGYRVCAPEGRSLTPHKAKKTVGAGPVLLGLGVVGLAGFIGYLVWFRGEYRSST